MDLVMTAFIFNALVIGMTPAYLEERVVVMAHPCNLDRIEGNVRWDLWQPR